MTGGVAVAPGSCAVAATGGMAAASARVDPGPRFAKIGAGMGPSVREKAQRRQRRR